MPDYSCTIHRFRRWRFPLLLLASLLFLPMAHRLAVLALTAAYDFLAVVEPLPAPAERELFMMHLTTHAVPLTGEERAILDEVLAAGYRRLLIYYSLPDPRLEKFVDCEPLGKGLSPAAFFRRKLSPLGLGEDRYQLLEVVSPYEEDEPFRTVAPELVRMGVRALGFSTSRVEQRRFAILARRHFPPVNIHSFNPDAEKASPDRSRWWRSHSGLEEVGAGYLRLLMLYLP